MFMSQFLGKVLLILSVLVSGRIFLEYTGIAAPSSNGSSKYSTDLTQTSNSASGVSSNDVTIAGDGANSESIVKTEDDTVIPGRPNQMEFQRIYTDNVWEGNRGIGGTGGGGSGDGSNPAMIRNLPKIMEDVINKYNVLKWLDAPCGRVRWTSKFLKEQQTKRLSEGKPELQYLGLDVVGSVIKMNTEEFWDEAAWTFELKDLETEAIPQGYDLILCRDALQHLPLKTALRVLKNFANSGARWLLTTSYPRLYNGNQNIKIGDYYDIDLKHEPFSLTKVTHEYDEGKCKYRLPCVCISD